MSSQDKQLPPEELEPDAAGEAIELEDTEEQEASSPEMWAKISPPDRKLITQPYDLAVSELVTQIANGDLILNPVYQRKYVWDNEKASKLIESLVINVPIPAIY